MISDNLLQLIQDNANELAERLCRDLLSKEETKGYRTLSEDQVFERVLDVYSNLGKWLGKDKETVSEVAKVYTELGRTRCRENIPLDEVVLAFMLIKRRLWLYVREKQFFDSTYELYQILELNNYVVYFFDRAIYYVTIGYEEEFSRK
ncbi:MAG TPA: hypothetical protein ENN05_10330 [Deltaproteobacteria bacterium]|nr:hypothetical protein [Deltaproteobacteria bacterium]